VVALVRGWGRPAVAAAGGLVALVVVAAVAWAAFTPGGGGGPPVELTLPRADRGGGSGAAGAGDGGGAAGSGSGSGAAAVSDADVVVHVAGAVLRPGLYRLGGDPRVADALDAAGGPSGDADLDAVNLAAKVADGERVYLPRRGEVPPASVAAAGAGGGGGAGVVAGPIDLNTATVEQLEELPGVGPATAEAILDYRKEKGRFRSVDELLEVRGIGEAKLASIRSKVRVR
jgi:competence protein ComEA